MMQILIPELIKH